MLIEILVSVFRTLDKNLKGWFGKKRKSKQIVQSIISELQALQKEPDVHEEQVATAAGFQSASEVAGNIGGEGGGLSTILSGRRAVEQSDEVRRNFSRRREKLQELDHILPHFKRQIEEFFELSKNVKSIIIQIDDLYHLRRTDQAFVVDYIHRLCKDVPLYFKIATLRHASTLYLDREGQPIGAQERHDYQPINIDYTFADFPRTKAQNWQILEKFAQKAGMKGPELESLFRGEGFPRLVMAGGGVPRDVLSLFLEVLGNVGGSPIGKDDGRTLSRSNFERRIAELKQDSHGNEQDELLKGIYIIREFCLDRQTNIFLVREKLLQQDDDLRSLFFRLLDYRIIHSAGSALTHKSQEGTYQAFAIDIGCYAHLRKLQGKFNETDVSHNSAKEKMRSAPVLEKERLDQLATTLPENVESALLEEDV